MIAMPRTHTRYLQRPKTSTLWASAAPYVSKCQQP